MPSEQIINDLYNRIDTLTRRIERLQNNAVPSLPILDPTNFPQDAIEGQQVVGTDDNLYFFRNGAWHLVGSSGGGTPWAPNVEALSGGGGPNDYVGWGSAAYLSDSGSGPVIAPDPGDNRIVYFPNEEETFYPNAVYEIKLIGSETPPPSPYSVTVYGMIGNPGSWIGVFGAPGFPGDQLGFGAACYGYWDNFGQTDLDPLEVRFLFACFGRPPDGAAFNAIAVYVNGGAVTGSAFELTIVQVKPGN